MRDLKVEQYLMVYLEWNGSALTWPRKEVSIKFHPITQEEEWNTPQNIHCYSCLVSNYTIFSHKSLCIWQVATAKIANKCVHQSRPCLERKGDRYQIYCTVYKTHTIATHHRSEGCCIDRDINLHVDNAETTSIDNDNESISGSNTTIALGGSEAEGNPIELIPSNQTKMTAHTRKINIYTNE